MDAVTVQNLSFSYSGGAEVLRDVSFTVSSGEIFVIAGLSGCGKTTLCHILSRVIPHSIPGKLSGRALIFGEEPQSLAKAALHVGLVFQDSDFQLICTAAEDELGFGLENLCVPPDEIRARVDDMLDWLGLTEKRLMSPAALSGGQKKLLALGSVLILNPEVVILDEPMTGLDEHSRELVRVAIIKLRERGKTVIIIEHDLRLVDYADRWLILHGGSIAALGTPENMLAADKALLRGLEMWLD